MPNQVETSRVLNLLRGGARGLTADVMGGPVDLATAVANLGVAGYGYGAHKLGLIDSPPDLIDPKTVPGSSDWFAKGTPLEEQEGEGKGYNEARMATGMASMLRGVGKTPVRESAPLSGSPEAQRGAIYLDKQGQPQGRDLAIYHTTEGINGLPAEYATDVRAKPPLKELTHPSFAITSDLALNKSTIDAFGRNVLIPDPTKLDPKTQNTVLKAHDFYSPRRGLAYESQLRELGEEAKQMPGAQELASARLFDRFGRQFVKGGTGGEGGSTTSGMIGWEPSTVSMNTTPRFQSYEHFLDSPKGAARLRKSDSYPSEMLRNKYDELAGKDYGSIRDAKGLDPLNQGVEIANALQSKALDPKYWANSKDPRFQDPEFVKAITERLRGYKKSLIDYNPSDYAEVKRYGPMQLNKDNFIGYIADTDKEYELAKWNIGKKGARTGVPVYRRSEFKDNNELHDYIADMQTLALRRRGKW
jgi:hypothetical protein